MTLYQGPTILGSSSISSISSDEYSSRWVVGGVMIVGAYLFCIWVEHSSDSYTKGLPRTEYSNVLRYWLWEHPMRNCFSTSRKEGRCLEAAAWHWNGCHCCFCGFRASV
ncbi:PREDICTED: uncharacterized protein LOC109181851 [Ipomoea nil]|uniref:uncharacterized protein LOC109181851 n=1 Tax=Ipomoea nil TaxID=35883 RepID=UPI0009016AA7|nr:PREDICTED: uncharacterized protein LOC109181851 [Ipomoea nil]XP_019187336.1 PREDICTED: uncharacterized protein LOC109181851 [Ipomoea nil]XP_019187337.1 PREDICTED: uncharacterized protein LOC109181851 [Ipomoea nil]